MNPRIQTLVQNIEKAVVGKQRAILHIIGALLCRGHVLVEDVPGVGKTQLISALCRSVGGDMNRVQMTPDVMPSDILGFAMIEPGTREVTYRHGAAMCNFLLVDEINRASPKAQSCLLEVMEERQISAEGKTFPLPDPFIALATQNPVETFGTYHLPEAQMDRFLLRVSVGYPEAGYELSILNRPEGDNPAATLSPVMSLDDILTLQKEVESILIHPALQQYILQITAATRNNEHIRLGASPRGSIGLQRAARARALMEDRNYVIPDDILHMAEPVLAHRLILSPKGKSAFQSQSEAIQSILSSVPVPVPQP